VKTVFNVGDLLKFKSSSKVFAALPASAALVLMTQKVSGSSRFFYGRVCSTGEEHLWSYDQFYLLSAAAKKISRKNFGVFND